jgi:hypothetical protein
MLVDHRTKKLPWESGPGQTILQWSTWEVSRYPLGCGRSSDQTNFGYLVATFRGVDRPLDYQPFSKELLRLITKIEFICIKHQYYWSSDCTMVVGPPT